MTIRHDRARFGTARTPSGSPRLRRLGGWLDRAARGAVRRGRAHAVRLGAPAAWFGFKHVEPEAPEAHARRLRAAGEHVASVEVVHPPRTDANALPRNVQTREMLPVTRGWWGYSMHDVPERQSGAALLVTVPGARVFSYLDDRGEFYPGILGRDGRALDTREIKFRPPHGEVLRAMRRAGREAVRLDRATWVMERVHDNHSHWLTAHLPKLLMLRDRGRLDDVLLPGRLTSAMEASLNLLRIDPARFRRYDPDRPLKVGALTIPITDRFDPRLLRPVRAAMPALTDAAPHRRLYISRAKARFRRLETEDALWPELAARGFEKVFLEDLSFPDQVLLMQEASVVVAPHGAGLTNVMFCRAGTLVAEIASLAFPNPNFYAVAAAMGHDYVLIPATARGDVPELERNLAVAPEAVTAALDRELAARPGASRV